MQNQRNFFGEAREFSLSNHGPPIDQLTIPIYGILFDMYCTVLGILFDANKIYYSRNTLLNL